jgi:hypothetical protein
MFVDNLQRTGCDVVVDFHDWPGTMRTTGAEL